MRMSRLAFCSLALVAVATTAHAQGGAGRPGGRGAGQGGGQGRGAMMKETMAADLERQRKNVLDYLNVAPDSMMRFRSTPGVRTFAQQIHHIASANAYILAQALGAAPMAAGVGDTTQLFTSKTALRDYVNASYDYSIKVVRDATPQQLMAEKELFGMKRNGARWVSGVLEHATWTLGQTVPYLRMNKVTPPNYLPF